MPDTHLRAARTWEAAVATPRHQQERLTRQVTIKVAGLSTTRPDALPATLMEQVARRSGATLRRGSVDQPLLDTEWEPQIEMDGAWKGDILVLMPDRAAAAAL